MGWVAAFFSSGPIRKGLRALSCGLCCLHLQSQSQSAVWIPITNIGFLFGVSFVWILHLLTNGQEIYILLLEKWNFVCYYTHKLWFLSILQMSAKALNVLWCWIVSFVLHSQVNCLFLCLVFSSSLPRRSHLKWFKSYINLLIKDRISFTRLHINTTANILI